MTGDETMANIQIIVDSALDIDVKLAKKHGIRIMPCHILTDDGAFLDGVDFFKKDVFTYAEATGKLPMTSQVTAIDWLNAYLDAYNEGKTDIIVITMNSNGSGTYSSACQAVNLLEDENEDAAKALNIRVIDSKMYSVPTELPIRRALPMIMAGASAREVADFIEDYYENSIILLGLGTLDYAKKSGRLDTVAAFVGEVLGLKPIMLLHGENKVFAKARGPKALIDQLAKLYMEMAEDPQNGEWAVAWSSDREMAKQLISAIKKLGGSAPSIENELGTCVTINTGPKAVGLGFKAKKK